MTPRNNGETKRKVWKIREDGEVVVEYPSPNGGKCYSGRKLGRADLTVVLGTKRLYAGYKDGDTRWLQSPEYYNVQACVPIVSAEHFTTPPSFSLTRNTQTTEDLP